MGIVCMQMEEKEDRNPINHDRAARVDSMPTATISVQCIRHGLHQQYASVSTWRTDWLRCNTNRIEPELSVSRVHSWDPERLLQTLIQVGRGYTKFAPSAVYHLSTPHSCSSSAARRKGRSERIDPEQTEPHFELPTKREASPLKLFVCWQKNFHQMVRHLSFCR